MPMLIALIPPMRALPFTMMVRLGHLLAFKLVLLDLQLEAIKLLPDLLLQQNKKNKLRLLLLMLLALLLRGRGIMDRQNKLLLLQRVLLLLNPQRNQLLDLPLSRQNKLLLL